MRDYLIVYVNGLRLEIGPEDAFRTLSDFLRRGLRAVGTKIVCEEGDCGACSVLVGRPEDGQIVYRVVNSCILQMHQIDGTHIVTIEGVRRKGALSAVQESMVTHHGAQCGFCTPGFVVAMTALFERKERLAKPEVQTGLTGNLCRCTGYEPILKAALAVDPAGVERMDDLYPPAEMLADFERHAGETVHVVGDAQQFFAPADLDAAVAFKAEHPEAVIVHGATDVGVWRNKRGFAAPTVLSLWRIPEMHRLAERDGVLEVGGCVTLTALEEAVRALVPELYRILRLFGAPQIRNAGTLAGNVANASPIADTLPFLFVAEAQIEVAGPNGRRTVDVDTFYLGYKTLDMASDEVIARILIPLPGPDETLRLYKVSKRRDLDISSFTAAVRMTERGGRIEQIRIAYGGVGPVVLRLPKTEAFLTGQRLAPAAFTEAGRLARQEIAPISDVRGSADYRLQLAENVLLKFYHELAGEEVYV